MKKILIIQAIIFIILAIASLIATGDIRLPLLAILSFIIGPIMAYTYPYELLEYVVFSLLFILAIILVSYGIGKKESYKGILTFTIGFWLWAFVGLLAGLSTGT